MPSWWAQFVAAALNDFRRYVADRRTLLVGLAVPIALAAFFAKVFDRPSGESRPVVHIDAALEADTPDARRLLALAETHPQLRVTRVAADQINPRLESHQSQAALLLPATVDPGAAPRIVLSHHPRHGLEARLAEAAVTEAVMRDAAAAWVGRLGLGPGALERAGVEWRRSAHPAPAGSGEFHPATHSFCGMAVQCLLFWGMETGLMLLRDRQRGVWRRLRAMPVYASAVVSARLASASAIAFGQMGLTFLAGAALFDIRFHGPGLMIVAAMAGLSLLAASCGLLVASLGRREARARHLSVVAILVAALLGGLWVPSLFLPEWVRPLSVAFPTTWAMRGLDAVSWQGLGATQAWPALAAIYGFAFAGGAVALVRLTMQERSLRRGDLP